MRPQPVLMALALTTALLAGCGKKSAVPDQAETPTEPASAPASAPTADQAKALLAKLPAPYSGADLVNGKRVFGRCATCHTIASGGPNMTGPNLYGIFGRKAGSVAGFSYSDGLKATGFTWDFAHLDSWITNPRAVVPGTRMSFAGLSDAKDRTDVLAYLNVQTSPSAP